MVMFEQQRRLAEPLHWGWREKRIIAALLSCLALAVAALLAYGLSSGSPARRDCIDVTFASTLGGADLHGCGAKARKICASGSQFRALEPELKLACRRAGFAFAG
jgi:hypothetical protein